MPAGRASGAQPRGSSRDPGGAPHALLASCAAAWSPAQVYPRRGEKEPARARKPAADRRSALFFAKKGDDVRVTDLKNEGALKPSLDKLKSYNNISYTFGEHKNEDIDWADIIIRNPAIKDSNPYIKYALEKGKRVETDFSIFLDFADQKKIIAVTGTKGKSTTASLIYEVLKKAEGPERSRRVVFAGNIGKSILDTIPFLKENPWIVVEISSFQLQALKDKHFAPYIAVITNIYPDHLNWHTSMEEYIQAKKIVTK